MIAANANVDRTGDAFDAPAAAVPGRLLQIVCFTLGEQTYGIGIESVREIRAWSPTTALPNSPDFLRGVVNLRGAILPIIDLRARFNQGRTEPGGAHVVIVIQVAQRLVGLLVDAVSDIVKLPGDAVKEVPTFGGAEAEECLDGLIAADGRMIALVSAERILAPSIRQSAA